MAVLSQAIAAAKVAVMEAEQALFAFPVAETLPDADLAEALAALDRAWGKAVKYERKALAPTPNTDPYGNVL